MDRKQKLALFHPTHFRCSGEYKMNAMMISTLPICDGVRDRWGMGRFTGSSVEGALRRYAALGFGHTPQHYGT